MIFAGLSGQQRTLATSVSGSATTSPPISVARALAATITGIGVVSDSISVGRSFQESIVGGASVTEALIVARSFAESIGASATVVDALILTRAFLESVSGSVSVAESMAVARALADSVPGSSSFSDTMSVSRRLSDTITGTATVSDAIAVRRSLNDGILGSASSTWDVTFVIAFLLTIAASSSLATMPMGVARRFLDPILGVAQTTEVLRVARSLKDSISSNATLIDQIVSIRAFSDSIQGLTSILANRGNIVNLSNTINAQASIHDAIAVQRVLSDTISGTGSIQDNLQVIRGLISSVSGQGSISPIGWMILSFFFLRAQGVSTMAETMVAQRPLGFKATGSTSIADPISVQRSLGLLASAQVLQSLALATNLFITSNNNILTVISPIFDLRVENVVNTNSYQILPIDGGITTQVLTSSPMHVTVATGTNGTILGPNEVSLGSQVVSPGQYVVIIGRWQNTKARVVSSPSLGVAILDNALQPSDPDNGSLSWTLLSPVRGMNLTIQEPTNGKTYKLLVSGLLTVNGLPFSASSRWTASVTGPAVLAAEFLSAKGGVLVSFSGNMLVDEALLAPSSYLINPVTQVTASVQVLSVQTVGPSEVLLNTRNFEQGTYTLTVVTGLNGPVTVVIDGPKDTSRNFISTT